MNSDRLSHPRTAQVMMRLRVEWQLLRDLAGSRSGEFYGALTVFLFGLYIADPGLDSFDNSALDVLRHDWHITEVQFGAVSAALGLAGLLTFRFGTVGGRLLAVSAEFLYWLFLMLLVIAERRASPLIPLFGVMVLRAAILDLRLAAQKK